MKQTKKTLAFFVLNLGLNDMMLFAQQEYIRSEKNRSEAILTMVALRYSYEHRQL